MCVCICGRMDCMYVCTCFCKCVCLCVRDTVTSVTTIEIRIYIKIYQFVVVVVVVFLFTCVHSLLYCGHCFDHSCVIVFRTIPSCAWWTPWTMRGNSLVHFVPATTVELETLEDGEEQPHNYTQTSLIRTVWDQGVSVTKKCP